jgi:hypothetical protein
MTTLLGAILSSCITSDVAGADPQVATLPLAMGVIGSDPETAEIDVLLLEGDDPVRDLFGFRAPASWSAMGVVASGRAHGVRSSTSGRFRAEPDACDPAWFELDGCDPDAPDPDTSTRIWLAMTVDRGGQQVTVSSHHPGSDPMALPDESPIGRIPDVCRRALGLATPAPQARTIELWAVLWLEQLLLDGLAAPRARSWAEVVACFGDVAHSGPSHTSPSHSAPCPSGSSDDEVTRRLVASGHQLGRHSWAELRQIWAGRDRAGLGVDGATAAWMDDGMFSREVLGGFPLIDDLVVELGAMLAPEVIGLLDRALRTWGVA